MKMRVIKTNNSQSKLAKWQNGKLAFQLAAFRRLEKKTETEITSLDSPQLEN